MAKASIYLNDKVRTIIGDTESGELSGRVAAIISRYDRMVRDLAPALTLNEWWAVVEANQTPEDCDAKPYVTRWSIEDMEDQELHGADREKLLAKLKGLSDAQQLAVTEIGRRSWLSEDGLSEERLKSIGAKIVDDE